MQAQTFYGTMDEQYWARIAVYGLWILGFVGLAVIVTARQPQPARTVIWSVAVFTFGLWFKARNDVAIPTGESVYLVQRNGRTILTVINPPRCSDSKE